MDALWELRRGRISHQVLNEYYVTVTRKLRPGLPAELARADVRDLMAWRPIGIDGALVEDAWWLEDRFALSWWDALVVAAGRALGCRYLLTEDLQAGQDLDGIVVVDPFATRPEQLLSG